MTDAQPRFSARVVATPAPTATARVPDPDDIGVQGPPASPVGVLTGTKPESKLWWHDGLWWASMWDVVTEEYRIFRLDADSQAWTDTRVPLDDRRASRADVKWDEQSSKLYVASHSYTGEARPGFPSLLYRFSYDSAIRRYELDWGFPVSINDFKTETLVIEKDSKGKLWATWVEGGHVWINATTCSPTCNDAAWGAPFVISESAVSSDDISSVIAFGGDQIGVMWSDQNAGAYHFVVHNDGDDEHVWTRETALSGPGMADDHIDLKADSDGRVYAAIKTSLTTAEDARVLLLARNASGSWSNHVFGSDRHDHTRPIALVDNENGRLYMFAASPSGGGVIYEKTTLLDEISFDDGLGTPVMKDADGLLSDPTSTKQPVDSETGLAILAYSRNGYYFYFYKAIRAADTPVDPLLIGHDPV